MVYGLLPVSDLRLAVVRGLVLSAASAAQPSKAATMKCVRECVSKVLTLAGGSAMPPAIARQLISASAWATWPDVGSKRGKRKKPAEKSGA